MTQHFMHRYLVTHLDLTDENFLAALTPTGMEIEAAWPFLPHGGKQQRGEAYISRYIFVLPITPGATLNAAEYKSDCMFVLFSDDGQHLMRFGVRAGGVDYVNLAYPYATMYGQDARRKLLANAGLLPRDGFGVAVRAKAPLTDPQSRKDTIAHLRNTIIPWREKHKASFTLTRRPHAGSPDISHLIKVGTGK